jgi:hypothetical protein
MVSTNLAKAKAVPTSTADAGGRSRPVARRLPSGAQLVKVGVTAGVSSLLGMALVSAAGLALPLEISWRAWPQWALMWLAVGGIHRTGEQALTWLLGPEPQEPRPDA